MSKETKYDSMMDEINDAKNPVQKDMLLQKYGLIAAKLTPAEKRLIRQQATIYYTVREVA